MSANFKLGRLARTFDPRVPHMSALLAGQVLPPPPPSADWTKGLPAHLGMMMNDTLGDCTCAAFYHAIQVWSFNANPPMVTASDPVVEALYEQGDGYNPAQGGEGPGGNEQHLLTYILKKGAPSPTGDGRVKIAAFVEVDPRSTDDVKRAIHHCGLVYIGFNVPAFLMPPNAPPPSVWDVEPDADNSSVGGHAVILAGYDAKGARVISWGQYYTMTWAFFGQFVDEVYALADASWIEAKGMSPGGLSLAELEAQMQALKA
ncbi:MAG TPA: hypothetical protein VG227_08460 [Caulobacteraceae bacterium]|jgi:hypothetical protein|nr:hypothetical protein [Caulobacteraceae bacterium]